jgi:hypothetical protein
MSDDTAARLLVTVIIYAMVSAVVVGIGLLGILLAPALAQHAFFWIPSVVLSSFVLSVPLSWFIAPLMMLRFARVRKLHHV